MIPGLNCCLFLWLVIILMEVLTGTETLFDEKNEKYEKKKLCSISVLVVGEV